jgi:hypothetical protein
MMLCHLERKRKGSSRTISFERRRRYADSRLAEEFRASQSIDNINPSLTRRRRQKISALWTRSVN